jgi:hypothetical protein
VRIAAGGATDRRRANEPSSASLFYAKPVKGLQEVSIGHALIADSLYMHNAFGKGVFESAGFQTASAKAQALPLESDLALAHSV